MRGVFVSISSIRQAICALTDTALLVAAFPAAAALRFVAHPDQLLVYDHLTAKAVLNGAVLALCLYYSDLYEDSAIRRRFGLFVRCAQAVLAGTVVLLLIYYMFPELTVGRGILTLYISLAFTTLVAWRWVFLWASSSDPFSDTVLILGTGQSARQVAEEILHRNPLGFRILGFLGQHPAEVGRQLVNPSVIGTMDDLEDIVRKHRVDVIVVALDDRRGKMPLPELLRCRMAGVRVEEVTNFFENVTGKILVKNLRPSWLVFSKGFNKPRLLENAKRGAELVAAVVLIVLLAPLLALLVLLIKLEGTGPVFYRQERVGERGRPFFLIKFRTMRADAETSTGPVWASEGDDPRMTRIGRYLRKVRLDELPQLINVLRGEMSFVGPRPERPHFVDVLRQVVPYYDERHSVKPGITGWAQVRFPYGATIEDAESKLEYDLYYVKHMSLLFDLGIILDTIKVMVIGKGAR